MAATVTQAFNEFLSNKVNLCKDETKIATSSRAWLVDRISEFPESIEKFPLISSEKKIFFGSFSRKTKIQPLDDIDIMICLAPDNCIYYEEYTTIFMFVADGSDRMRVFCDDGSTIINSRKVINKFVSSLETVPQYKSAKVKRNQEAAVLQLCSYDWDFDIVPCFFISCDASGKPYYIIPDGNGNWKKTDPKVDNFRTQQINQTHDGIILNLIRIMKYWNKRHTMPLMGSYLLETLILNHYEYRSTIASKYIDSEILLLLNYIKLNITSDIQDNKGIQGNINTLTTDERVKISSRANQDEFKATEALFFRLNHDHSPSISKWAEIFGPEFPNYG